MLAYLVALNLKKETFVRVVSTMYFIGSFPLYGSLMYYGIGTVKNDVKAYEYYLLAKQLGVTDIELDMNMSTLSAVHRKAAVDKFENFRPRMNDYSITYLRMPKFMK